MENQRVRLSKTMLKNALLDLLREKDIAQVSVTEICQRAQINRTTFYKHYGSQYELLDDAMNDFFDELEEYLKGNEAAGEVVLTNALELLSSQRDRVRILMTALPDDVFRKRLFAQKFVATFRDDVLTGDLLEPTAHYVGVFFGQGVYAIVHEWIMTENPETPEQIARIIFSLRTHLS